MESMGETLCRLKHCHPTVSEAPEDIRGRKVFDSDSTEIGQVNDLFVDRREMQARIVGVASDGILGIGNTLALLPVAEISTIDKDTVFLDPTAQTIAGAPKYAPQATEQTLLSSLSDYSRYSPYWGVR